MSVAPYKRRVVDGVQCGVSKCGQTRCPEALDSAEEMNLVDGVMKDLIRVALEFEYVLVRLIITR
ncbi:hypothetical protein [Rhodohalobacter sp. 8-1]|uniref:hypothetical protein n=1 Tax=Rhodohalobacter sp. 8-1 TaxID=3131972 RepID=UPI0030EE7656